MGTLWCVSCGKAIQAIGGDDIGTDACHSCKKQKEEDQKKMVELGIICLCVECKCEVVLTNPHVIAPEGSYHPRCYSKKERS